MLHAVEQKEPAKPLIQCHELSFQASGASFASPNASQLRDMDQMSGENSQEIKRSNDSALEKEGSAPGSAIAPGASESKQSNRKHGKWFRFRRQCYKLQRHPRFEHTTTGIIILNAIIMALIW